MTRLLLIVSIVILCWSFPISTFDTCEKKWLLAGARSVRRRGGEPLRLYPIPLLENGSKVQTKSTILAATTVGIFSLDRAQGYYPEPNVLGGI